MFSLKDYVECKVGDFYINNNIITIPAYITIDEEKIKGEVSELKEILFNLRKLFGKDYVLVVTEDKIKFMKEEE